MGATLGLNIEQPPYELLATLNDHVEIRKYMASKWVSASVVGEAHDFSSERSTLFRKLFKYISGRNDEEKKIPMTSPVLMNYSPSEPNQLIDPNTKCAMSMGFYVPKENQDKTPNPTGDAQMYVKSEPEMIVAVARFGGYASLNDYLNYRDEIIKLLGNEAQNYDCINMMTAGYDPPFKPIYRTNEVWLRKIR
jgi:hypothetical protein